ncbi:type II toxin-antitoxin system VapC family toxin [Novosphingobium sp. JCM 18896]|uniref:type II toxin-antitoxin system VapC family toxin n=1 Tax=Novosphingobium sp. JCM 18896 TaxID=2989731 RepID=UPI002222C76F|nr:type II toxin-antitoxin system VapC family toxin [Novosphingobium sp. JCM 18896]MCW1431056.1 type II toxin-antitoxin system VapC family toxin [Novosphingobium sp. JCM 18896]
MRAIDTNIVIRFLTADDKRQAEAARAVISGGDIFIPTTVLLESEWVLRSAYGLTAGEIVAGLRGLAGLPGISVEEPFLLAQALTWMSEGMDFADALHLAKSGDCRAFLTFDQKLIKAAGLQASILVETP